MLFLSLSELNMKLKIILIFFITVFSSERIFSQKLHEVYQLENELMLGNKGALLKIASYFDSKKELIEYLGYHIIKTNESKVAKRIVEENCLFTRNEILISEKTTAKEFESFLNENFDKISFSHFAKAFLLTPLDKRTSQINAREISAIKKQELQQNSYSLLNLDWVKTNNIDLLIKDKNPKALLFIASEFYKHRNRFNKSFFRFEEFADLIRMLTGTEFEVENNYNQFTWFVEKEFYPDASLNLLIYFVNNYDKYKWNDKKALFENEKLLINQLNKEDFLFKLLESKNDSIAKNAFEQLTICKSEIVVEKANQYQKANIDKNNKLPTFPFNFLRQLVVLTEYCKKNNIDFDGSKELAQDIGLLESNLSFFERRKLEDKLIENLTLDQITAFEYHALLDEKSWELTYSSGRILDVFYSKNWKELLSNEKHLKLYLKKSSLFKKLGIIGICNKYENKFKDSKSDINTQLDLLDKTDLDIKEQIEIVKAVSKVQVKRPNILKKEFEGNSDYVVSNLGKAFAKIKNDGTEEYEKKIINLLSKINYKQIRAALELIKDVKIKARWKSKYSFLDDDFGFFWIEDSNNQNERREFLKAYNQYSEFDLYSYFLKQSGIDYLYDDNSLNYDKIYELLKYDIVVAFVGGGGGKRNNEVYALIKLLEIKHKTTLGYPKKLCNSDGIYACYADDRAIEWMQFFEDHNLLKLQHTEPVSFNLE